MVAVVAPEIHRSAVVAKPSRRMVGEQIIAGIDQQQLVAGWSMWGGPMTAAEVVGQGVLQATPMFHASFQEDNSQTASQTPPRRKEQDISFQSQGRLGLSFLESAAA